MKPKRCSNQRQRATQLSRAARARRRPGQPHCAHPTPFIRSSGREFRRPGFRVVPVDWMADVKAWLPVDQAFHRKACQGNRREAAWFRGRTTFAPSDNSIPSVANDPPPAAAKPPRRDSEEDYIVIPPAARAWDLSVFPFSTRLKNILANRECRRLGDLHGLRFSRILRWRNLGGVTLRTLIAFVKSVQQGDWGLGSSPDLTGWPPAWEL